MDARNQPVCTASSVEEQFLDTYYSMKEKVVEWQDQCWDAGQINKQDGLCRRSKSLSNESGISLNFHEYFNQIQRKLNATNITEPLGTKIETKIVNGEDAKDIPTIYSTTGFKSHEKIVIGTFVDKNIIPGFQYKVRKNCTEDYLFDANARILENVGLGYGKRLTFQGKNLNSNKNYFWSDSHEHGFGFSFQTISSETVFRIMDTNINRDIGRVIVNNPARSVDVEITTDIEANGKIRKTVKVHFSGDVILYNNCLKQNIFYEDMEIRGTAIICRENFNSKAKINKIILHNFIVDDCILVLEE